MGSRRFPALDDGPRHLPIGCELDAATPPPIILMAAIEGLSLLLRRGRRSKVTSRLALMMTVFLAVVAFVPPFEALRDLAVRSDIPKRRHGCGDPRTSTKTGELDVDAGEIYAQRALVVLRAAGSGTP